MKRPVSPAAFAACLCALMVTTACRSAETTQPVITGGWNTIPADGADVDLAARAAVAQLPTRTARLTKVVKAERQVVAGTNYHLVLSLDDGSAWDVTVWHRLDNTYQVTDAKAMVAAPALRLTATGLRVEGGAAGEHVIPYGAAKAEVIAALKFRGQPSLETNDDCGAGPTEFATWPNGLSLLFQHGEFLGWSIDDASSDVALVDGTRMGMTLAQMRTRATVTVEQSTLGEEFSTADGVSGILDVAGEQGHVTALWAGLSCVFR